MKLSTYVRTLSLGFVFVLMGCGSSGGTCTISGKVTSQGKPLHTGVISFYGAKGEFASGGIDTEGNYLIYDAPTGLLKVAVVSDKPSADMDRARKNEGTAPATAGPPPVDPSKWVAIDKKYADPATSGKEITVSGGSNTKDIALD